MTRRSSTTLTISIQLRIPAGSSAKEMLTFVRDAVANWKGSTDNPHNKPDINSMLVKLVRRETTYL